MRRRLRLEGDDKEMTVKTLLRQGSLSVLDYRCTARPADRPFLERHTSFSLSYVRRGSFGCRTRGKSFELVAGSVLVGYPGDEYMCIHDHHACGDECLSFGFTPAFANAIGDRAQTWRVASVPPLPELMVLGELAQAAADRNSDVSLDEAGMLLASRFIQVVSGRKSGGTDASSRDRRRAVDAACWIDAHRHEPITLESAASYTGLSAFHFLRLFRAVLGLTPHQYLIRCRLRRAAQLLCDDTRPVTDIALDSGFGDLSNFIRTFRRAAQVSPRAFRLLAGSDRRDVQKRLSCPPEMVPGGIGAAG